MTLFNNVILSGFGLSVAFAGAALTQGKPDKPLPESRKARLLEQFGDQGIDANGDGVLTRAEVHEFFADQGFGPGWYGFGKGGPGHRGRRGHAFGPGGPLGHMLRTLDRLQGETPPSWFTIERFPDADVNGDGELGSDEWQSFAEGHRTQVLEHLMEFAPQADTDNDGELSEAELDALRITHMTRMRTRILARHPDADTDGDGTLSDEELEVFMTARRAVILERHPEADLDGDGVLTEDEAEAFAMDNHPGRGGPRGWGHGRRHGPGGMTPPPPEQVLECHPEADTDGDGTLSEEELRAFLESRPCGPCGDAPRHGRGHGRGPCGPRR